MTTLRVHIFKSKDYKELQTLINNLLKQHDLVKDVRDLKLWFNNDIMYASILYEVKNAKIY